jgi:hypothetical protein
MPQVLVLILPFGLSVAFSYLLRMLTMMRVTQVYEKSKELENQRVLGHGQTCPWKSPK